MVPEGEDTFSAATSAAFCDGDHEAFARVARRHHRELRIHCYRMVGSLDEAEDLVQETFLRAWHRRETYQRRAHIRSWLYRIATNVCIDAIRKRAARELRPDDTAAAEPAMPWMQPVPDALLDQLADAVDPPDVRAVTRETIEMAFLTALQLLPAKQRAVLILRDVLDFSAVETAEALGVTTAAVNSALQRARETLRRRRPLAGSPPPRGDPSFGEALFLQAYMDAQQRGDAEAIIEMLREDVRMTLFPAGTSWHGREEVTCEFLKLRDTFGDARSIAIAANRQPALAVYRRRPGDDAYRSWAIVLLGVADGKVRQIATFATPTLFARFGLPDTLS